MTESAPTIPASTFTLLHSPAAAQVLSSKSWDDYRNRGARNIAAYLSCHDLQDLLNIIKTLYQPIWQFHARSKPRQYRVFFKVVQHLETYKRGTRLEYKEPSDLDHGADYLCDVWALASKNSKIAARFEVKGSLESVRSLHKMWSLQSWIRGNKEWLSRDELSSNQKRITIPPWLNNDEEELKQAEEKATLSATKGKKSRAHMENSPGVSQEPSSLILILWDIDDAAEEIDAKCATAKMNLDSIADMTWEYFRDEIRRCFPMYDRSENIDKVYLLQHVSSTDMTETELLRDFWTDQRTTLSNQDPCTTNFLFTSKKVSSTELRDAFWETWSPVMDIWAEAIAEERERELEGIEDPKERQKRMQPREYKAELETRLTKYRERHPSSVLGLELRGSEKGKRIWEMVVDEPAIDEKMPDVKRKKV